MDLGIAGARALITASSRGIGFACAAALANEGVDVVINGLDPGRLEAARAALETSAGVRVSAVAADISTRDGRARLLEVISDPDILVTNNGGPRPGSLFDVDDDDLEQALDAHLRAPLDLLRTVIPAMRSRRFGRVVNITSAMVASPNPTQIPSSAARTSLTAVMKATSHQVAVDNVLINQILPFRIASDRQRDMARLEAARDGVTEEEAWRRQTSGTPVRRHGSLDEIGAACAFLCSRVNGYINGVNLRLDGGAYAGLL